MNDLNLSVAQWLDTSWTEYLRSKDRFILDGVSRNYDGGDLVRASKVSFCPKLHAYERGGMEMEPVKLPLLHLRRIEDGYLHGMSFEEGIHWYAEQTKQRAEKAGIENKLTIANSQEHHANEQFGLTGTPDAIIQISDRKYPVEIKKTGIVPGQWEPGFKAYAAEQLIGYMLITGAKQGMLVSIYNMSDTQPVSHAVFIIEEDTLGWRVYNIEGDPVEAGRYLPHDESGDVYFEKQAYFDMLAQHRGWLDDYKENGPRVEAPEGVTFDHRWCSEFVPAEHFVRGPRKGQLKPGTGISRKSCPLYDLCWKGKGTDEQGNQ